MVDINIQTVLEMLSQLIGIEGAEKIVNEAIVESRLDRKTFYAEEEFIKICEVLKTKGGSIKIFASLVMTSEYREKQYQKIIINEKKQREELAILFRKTEQLNNELISSNEKLQKAHESLKKMQKDLVRSEKMATMGQLASSIAHEIRNPLAGIKNIKYYLAKYLKTEDPKIIGFLNLLSSEIDWTNKIITELMDYTQVKKLHKTSVFINEMLEEFILTMPVSEKINVINDFSPEAKQVWVDQDKMRQVFANIVSNAYDAMNNDGTLSIITEVVKQENELNEVNEFISIIFRDTGKGINQEMLPRVFEPLVTSKTKGIGLGLSIVKDIIETHHGKISIESQENIGTSFTILMPVEEPPKETPPSV